MRDAASLCSIGTLLAFVIVSVGILVLRVREPNLPRKFKTPWVWFVAPAGALSRTRAHGRSSMADMATLAGLVRIGIVIYFLYGVRRSNLAQSRV